MAVSLEDGRTLFAQTPEQSLAPASSLKLFTTAAALHYLGADYRFHTYLLTDGRIENGVLTGDVYLYGTGDPTLGTRFAPRADPTFYAFADTLALLGVREVRGRVIGDGSYFTGRSYGEGWEQDYMNAWYAAPAGALSAHENLVRLEVSPSANGTPAIAFVPGGEGIAVVHNPRPGGVIVRREAYDGAILIDGVPKGQTSHALPVGDPARYTAALLRDVLLEKGITVTGGIDAIVDPKRSPVTSRTVFAPKYEPKPVPVVLAVHQSPPLREILEVVNHQSHNFYAEQVLRAVGRVAYGDGSAEGGARAVLALLERAGGDTTGVRMKDGSGLSPLNRVPARAFVALLAHVARAPYAQEFDSTMTVAGRAPRFRRMGGTPAEGNLRGKTGTIDSVSALAGYVRTLSGERVAFAIIGNHLPSVGQAKYVENVIGATLASFGGKAVLPSESEVAENDEQRGRAPADPPGSRR